MASTFSTTGLLAEVDITTAIEKFAMTSLSQPSSMGNGSSSWLLRQTWSRMQAHAQSSWKPDQIGTGSFPNPPGFLTDLLHSLPCGKQNLDLPFPGEPNTSSDGA